MQRKSLWGSYKALSPKTRIMLGVGGMIFATVGMFISDSLEEAYPPQKTDLKKLEELAPVIVDHSGRK